MKKSKPDWRTIEDFHVLKNGENFFPKLLQACTQAQYTIHVSLYWFESGRTADQFIHVFLEARKRNVIITLLLDQIGSFDLSRQDRQRLVDAGVILGWFNPVKIERLHLIFQRDHSKLFIIDRKVLFIGGTGIADIFSPQSHPHSWRENMFEIKGSILTDALQTLKRKWSSSHTQLESSHTQPSINLWLDMLFPEHQYNDINQSKTEQITDDKKGLWLESESASQRSILKEVIYRIKHSQNRIILATAYFAPAARLRYALKKAAQRGVDVTLLVPGIVNDHPIFQRAGQYYYHGLMKKGVKIYEFQKSFMHSKLVICDDFVCIGSSNLDIYTQRWSLEANIAILDRKISREMTAMLEDDLKNSSLIEPHHWNKREIGIKFLNYLAYSISCLGNNWARQLLLLNRYAKSRNH